MADVSPFGFLRCGRCGTSFAVGHQKFFTTSLLPPRLIGAHAMQLERVAGTANIIDVLDRVLDKGIVIDAWVSVSVVGIELVTVQARVVDQR
jgi:hypothetical protein